MNVLLVAATIIEIAPFLEKLKKGGISVNTDVLISGIGLTATTYSLTRQIQVKRPDIIVQAGVGGCFDTSAPMGSVFCIKQEAIADQSVIELNKLKTIFDLKLVPGDKHPFKKGWLINRNDVLKKTPLKKVRGISVNEITTSRQKIKFYESTFQPVVESMEGAALHYVCLMEGIPFIQIRSISNYIGERNKKNWDMQGSIRNLNNELIALLNKL